MFKVSRELFGYCILVLASVGLTSCNNLSSPVFGSQTHDSLGNKVDESVLLSPRLHDKWDSLRRNLIVFTVDSLNPVSIKVQKQKLKDSLRSEYDKMPKHIYLTFDDGPLVGSRLSIRWRNPKIL